MNDNHFVELDVHEATISIAVAEAMRGGEVHNWVIIPNRADKIAKLAKKLGETDRQLSFC
ncbi:microcompartment protein CcmL/EutN [Bradyrhizobium sp. GM0.4]